MKQNKYVEPDINTNLPLVGIFILIVMGIVALIYYLFKKCRNKAEAKQGIDLNDYF